MKDLRFDRMYLVKLKSGELQEFKDLCHQFEIKTNHVFIEAKDFHIAYGICDEGLVYLSPTMFLYQKPDFVGVESLHQFLMEKTPTKLC